MTKRGAPPRPRLRVRLAPEEEPDLQSLLGPPPLLEGEDASAYEALKFRILAAVKPEDAIEQMWVRDVLDLLWETTRLRRLKAKLMHAAAHEGLKRLLSPLVFFTSRFTSLAGLVQGWALRNPETVKEVNEILRQAGLGEEAIAAQTLAAKLDTFEKIDRMIMQTEARRHLVLREIDRRRDVLARRLREASAGIEDGKYALIAPPAQEAAE
jgi:hypothetical protein